MKHLLIALDGDSAGQAATERLIEQLQPQLVAGGLSASVVQLPEGQDADGLLRSQGASAIEGLIALHGTGWSGASIGSWLPCLRTRARHRLEPCKPSSVTGSPGGAAALMGCCAARRSSAWTWPYAVAASRTPGLCPLPLRR